MKKGGGQVEMDKLVVSITVDNSIEQIEIDTPTIWDINALAFELRSKLSEEQKNIVWGNKVE